MDNPIRLLSAIALQGALETTVLPAFTRQTGRSVEAEWAPTTIIVDRVTGGAQPDAIIVTDGAVRDLHDKGIADSTTAARLCTAVLGVAIPEASTPPDISSLGGFCSALVKARSVCFSRAGASGIYFRNLIEELGIGQPILEKATIIPSGFTAEKLITGEADLAIQQISELCVVKGVKIVGQFPAEVQQKTPFSAVSLRSCGNPQDARLLISFLANAMARNAYGDAGLLTHDRA
ncbi:substrate-binding domain-containing protein [Agrobacterium rhizogenes]|uniref:molybdate ABC transporter substrate-binding protein n=1 Tax=Rhizobium rhizogenes TaxID=359 RepID=UPI0022B6F0FF|nr:substrate-binding domain-containing protein [Rhizobium rhizogenes]MCZ7447262.1 substrate-binding domain-containing protein [Rhizobium rhizogenes]